MEQLFIDRNQVIAGIKSINQSFYQLIVVLIRYRNYYIKRSINQSIDLSAKQFNQFN